MSVPRAQAEPMPGLLVMRFTPILTLTAESQQAKRGEARKHGASGRLVKPVAAAELIKVIRQVLPRA